MADCGFGFKFFDLIKECRGSFAKLTQIKIFYDEVSFDDLN